MKGQSGQSASWGLKGPVFSASPLKALAQGERLREKRQPPPRGGLPHPSSVHRVLAGPVPSPHSLPCVLYSQLPSLPDPQLLALHFLPGSPASCYNHHL